MRKCNLTQSIQDIQYTVCLDCHQFYLCADYLEFIKAREKAVGKIEKSEPKPKNITKGVAYGRESYNTTRTKSYATIKKQLFKEV